MRVSERKGTESRKWPAFQYTVYCTPTYACLREWALRERSLKQCTGATSKSPKLVWEAEGRKKMT